MKSVTAVLMLMTLFPALACAGEIYGGVQPAKPGIEININCSGRNQNAYTDQYGSYRTYVPEGGKCTLKVRYDGNWTDEIDVNLSDRPVRYDLVAEGSHLSRQ